jgi:nickel-dependent lactate racemase
MKIDLRYCKSVITLQIPDGNVAEVIRPWQHQKKTQGNAIVRDALADEQVNQFQNDIAGKHLCILIDDGTREEPFEKIFARLLRIFDKGQKAKLLICTGTHEAETPENRRIERQIARAAEKIGISDLQIHVHDCERDAFVAAGMTSRGTQVRFNSKAEDAGVFLVVSDMKVHYFAGYSNPIKNFVPGICAFETAEQNHALALHDRSTFGIHPWHRDPDRRDNPLAEDQLQAMQLIVKDRPVYAFTTISTAGTVQWARFGPVDQVCREAFTVIDDRNTHAAEPTERLIVSPGGSPNDSTLYNAQRALELTKNAVRDGGEILLLAACAKGIGESKTMENFYDRLTAPLDQVLKSIECEYKLFSHKAYKFAQLIQRLRRIWIYSQISDKVIEAAHLNPVHEPQAVVDKWLAETPNARITVVDGANRIALYPKP